MIADQTNKWDCWKNQSQLPNQQSKILRRHDKFVFVLGLTRGWGEQLIIQSCIGAHIYNFR
jgi:hypothetical protein